MIRPLPPLVHGPITPATLSIQVTAVAPTATVELLVAGVPCGSATSDRGGTVWVVCTTPFRIGQRVTARQHTADGASDESAHPVVVVALPDPVPAPFFASPLSTCMTLLHLDGLIPQTTAVVRHQGVVVGTAVARYAVEVVSIDPRADLRPGDRLEATQEIGGQVSAPAISVPLVRTDREQPLPPPRIVGPVHAGQTTLTFAAMTPTASVTVVQDGDPTEWLNVAPTYHAWGAPPLQPGKLMVTQQFARCDLRSPTTIVPVGPPVPPPQPVVVVVSCPALRQVVVQGLVPNAVIVLATVEPDPTTPGAETITALGEATVSMSTERFTLPSGVEAVTRTGAPVRLTAWQTLHGLPSPTAARVGFATPGASAATPQITGPLVGCARRLRVTEAQVGALLQPFDADSRSPLGDAVLAWAPHAILPLWFPLVAGRAVHVRQIGCVGTSTSPVEPIRSLPQPLPPPTIVEPVRPRAGAVTVQGCVPGARVYLLVNQVAQPWVEVLAATATIPTGDLVLAEHDRLWAVQALCAQESSHEGVAVQVRRGTLNVSVQPRPPLQRGVSTRLTVQAYDAETGVPIAGAQVLLDGQVVGQTGMPFGFTPRLGQPNVAGVVRAPHTHTDGAFTISLLDPPPKAPGALWMSVGLHTPIPNVLRLMQATWTVTPAWAPPQTATWNRPSTPSTPAATATLMLPDPPAAPADRQVRIVLDTTWEVEGMIEGIPFLRQRFLGVMDRSPIELEWRGQNLTVGWMVYHHITYDLGGQPWLNVTTKWQGAQ